MRRNELNEIKKPMAYAIGFFIVNYPKGANLANDEGGVLRQAREGIPCLKSSPSSPTSRSD